jgi:hypothetical protein
VPWALPGVLESLRYSRLLLFLLSAFLSHPPVLLSWRAWAPLMVLRRLSPREWGPRLKVKEASALEALSLVQFVKLLVLLRVYHSVCRRVWQEFVPASQALLPQEG